MSEPQKIKIMATKMTESRRGSDKEGNILLKTQAWALKKDSDVAQKTKAKMVRNGHAFSFFSSESPRSSSSFFLSFLSFFLSFFRSFSASFFGVDTFLFSVSFYSSLILIFPHSVCY